MLLQYRGVGSEKDSRRSACPQCQYVIFFFFQAEDGIRDLTVTGVQTCALPISTANGLRAAFCPASTDPAPPDQWYEESAMIGEFAFLSRLAAEATPRTTDREKEIGRAHV